MNTVRDRILSNFDEVPDPVCAYDEEDRVIYTNRALRDHFPFVDWTQDLRFEDVFYAAAAFGGGASEQARQNPEIAARVAINWRRQYPNNEFVRTHRDGTRWRVTERELIPGLRVQVRQVVTERDDIPPFDLSFEPKRFIEACPNFDPIECFRWLDYLRLALEALPGPIGVVGEKCRLAHCNEAFAAWLDSEDAAWLAHGNCLEFADAGLQALVNDMLEQSATGAEEQERLRPLRNSDGRTVGFVRLICLKQSLEASERGPAAVIVSLAGAAGRDTGQGG